MLTKRILGIIIIISGALMLISSFYIKSRVSSGKEQIAKAKEKVRRGKQLFSLNPVTKEVGKEITTSAEKKIKEGSAKIDKYNTLAMWLQVGGGILFAIGAGLIYMSRKKK